MAENKRYYWLKLMDDFFDSKRIKKLRKMAGGDTYTIIYLKMQLLSLKKVAIWNTLVLKMNFTKRLPLILMRMKSTFKLRFSIFFPAD